MEEKEIIVTQEGYNKLEEELNYLKTTKRTEIAERIKIALGFGDLSENAEYDEAKTAQSENEQEIAELELKIRNAKLHDIEFDEDITYTIVGSTEVSLSENKISNESPLGKALLGSKVGDTVEVDAPAGISKYKILDLQK